MTDTIYPIKYKGDYNVIMLNDIIKGKQSMTLQEAKLIRLLIIQVVKEDKDFKTYVISIKELAKYLNVSDSNLYRDIKNICDMLMTRIIKLSTGDAKKPWRTIQWLQLAEYDGCGNIKLMLSNQMEPYILGLNSWFTKYSIKEIFSMSSFYAIRIYELLSMEKNIIKQYNPKKSYEVVFSISYLRQVLDCENKFKQISQFKQKLLDISIKEINKYTDMQVKYECIKTSRTITDIKFIISVNSNSLTKEDNKKIDDLIDQLQVFISEPIKIKDLKAILKAADNDVKLIEAKYELAKHQTKIDNLTAWLISAVKSDYTEPISRTKKNKFVNYEQDTYDFDKLEQLERERIKKELEKDSNTLN